MGKYQSGQMGQTVNLLAYAFGGSNPSLPTTKKRNRASFFYLHPTKLAISRYFFRLMATFITIKLAISHYFIELWQLLSP